MDRDVWETGKNGRRPGEFKSNLVRVSSLCARQLVCTPPASGGHQFPGGGGLKVRLLPGELLPSGPDNRGRWGEGDEPWRRQKGR